MGVIYSKRDLLKSSTFPLAISSKGQRVPILRVLGTDVWWPVRYKKGKAHDRPGTEGCQGGKLWVPREKQRKQGPCP